MSRKRFSRPSRNCIKSLAANSNQAPAVQLVDPQRNEFDRSEDTVSMAEITASI